MRGSPRWTPWMTGAAPPARSTEPSNNALKRDPKARLVRSPPMTRRVMPPGRLQIGMVAGFKSEYPAGFIGSCKVRKKCYAG